MTLLSDLPWLHAATAAALATPAGLADAAWALQGPLCVVVPPGIRPWPDAGHLSPDPALTSGPRALLYPAVNALTGDCASDRGLWVAAPALVAAKAATLLSQDAALALAPVVPPEIAADWDCGATPQDAFRAGHAAMAAPRCAALALSASLGADHVNGPWWGIGATRALLGADADRAWAEEVALATPDDGLTARWAELARMVRLRCGLPVRPLPPEAAAALRRMRAPLPPPEVWDRYTATLQRLLPGAGNAPRIAGLRLARQALWGRDRND